MSSARLLRTFFLAAGKIVQLPLLREIQSEARLSNSRGSLSLNKTPMPRVGLFLFHPYLSGFRMSIPHSHHQLLKEILLLPQGLLLPNLGGSSVCVCVDEDGGTG